MFTIRMSDPWQNLLASYCTNESRKGPAWRKNPSIITPNSIDQAPRTWRSVCDVSGMYFAHFGFPASSNLANITIVAVFSCQIIRQKSTTVWSSGPSKEFVRATCCDLLQFGKEPVWECIPWDVGSHRRSWRGCNQERVRPAAWPWCSQSRPCHCSGWTACCQTMPGGSDRGFEASFASWGTRLLHGLGRLLPSVKLTWAYSLNIIKFPHFKRTKSNIRNPDTYWAEPRGDSISIRVHLFRFCVRSVDKLMNFFWCELKVFFRCCSCLTSSWHICRLPSKIIRHQVTNWRINPASLTKSLNIKWLVYIEFQYSLLCNYSTI